MQAGVVVTRVAVSLVVAGTVGALSGCQSIREAMGTTKAAPDEFTVVTQAPLIVPPDYNLRPPQPGAPARNAADPTAQARAALFTASPEAAAASLGPTYSEAEKTLLARSGAANVDPSIRDTLSEETGYESGDPALTDRVLNGPSVAASTAPATAPTPPAAGTAPAVAPQSEDRLPDTPGFPPQLPADEPAAQPAPAQSQ